MSEKIEKVGNVVLNYEYYDGNDYYSEGEAENYLLDLVIRFTEKDYEHVIQNSRSWSVMYHLSHIRENIISWFPISKKSKILEVGAGCGAITGVLSKMGSKVTCIELSKKRSLINATRHKEMNNIEIMVGNFETIEPNITEQYDYITLIGVLEYAGSYIHSESPYVELLEKVSRHLAPGGKIIVAIENKYGLKYLAGCKEDHTGTYFEGIEGYTNSQGVETFGIRRLHEIVESIGMQSKFYYPYPDYKLPSTIYSDEHLPKPGELNTNLRNYDNDRIVLFDESKAFDSIINDGAFPFFSNSYFVVLSKENLYDVVKEVPIYAKYANERVQQYRTSTIICNTKDNIHNVYKVSQHHDANEHIKNVGKYYDTLLSEYEGTKLKPNKCTYIEGHEPVPLVVGATPKSIDVLKLEFLEGISLEKYLYDLVKEEKFDEVTSVIKQFRENVVALSKGSIWRQTDRFKKIFGERKFEKIYSGKANSNFDLIFSNIVFDKNEGPSGTWNILDYEWSFDFPIPDEFLAFRGLYYFAEFSDCGYKEYFEKQGLNVYKVFGYTDDEIAAFIDMEHRFQVYIIGGVASLEVLHSMMPVNTTHLDFLIKERESLRNLNNPKIYFSFGNGFAEERRIYVTPTLSGASVSMEIPLKGNMRALRIDPTEYPSVVSVSEIAVIDQEGNSNNIERYIVNGFPVSNRTFIYDTDDAQIIIDGLSGTEKSIKLTYEVSMFLPNVYEDVKNMAKSKVSNDNKLLDKVLTKLKLKKQSEVLLEGYHYNDI